MRALLVGATATRAKRVVGEGYQPCSPPEGVEGAFVLYATSKGFSQTFFPGDMAQAVFCYGAGVYEIKAFPLRRSLRPFPKASIAVPLRWKRTKPPTPPTTIDPTRFYEEIIAPHLGAGPGITLIPAPPRSGKTVGAVELVRRIQSEGKRILYIAPTRDLAVAFWILLSQQGISALLHLGRGVGVVKTRWGDYDATNCHPSKIDHIATAFALGRNPDEVCATCTYSDCCLYRKTRRTATEYAPGVVVTTHRSAEFLGIPADFVIVDETPTPETVSLPAWTLTAQAEGEVGEYLKALLESETLTPPSPESLRKARSQFHPASAFLTLLERGGRVGMAVSEDTLYVARIPVLHYENGVLLDATPVREYAQAVFPHLVWNNPPRWKGVRVTMFAGVSRQYARRFQTDPATRFDLVARTGRVGVGTKDAHTHAYFYATRGKGGMEGAQAMVVLAGYYLSPPAAQVAIAACLEDGIGRKAAKWQWQQVGELENGDSFCYPFPSSGKHTDPTTVTEALQAIGRCFPTQRLNVVVYGILRVPIPVRVITLGDVWFPRGKPADVVWRLK